ncbi:hypothetical protein [Luteibacter sp.]|uniref:hypothetical protein n=1 Tax=Luteibacter sp. TaxID=1886636 RepID=UPI003F81FE09
MRQLTVALTSSLTAQWSFSHVGDFERAGAAAMSVLKKRRMVDVGDLQALVDAIDTEFESCPANGQLYFAFVRAEEAVAA